MTKSPPAHWVQQTGPCQWFQFWHPPGWQVETTGNGFDLTAPDGGGTLSLIATWDLRPVETPLRRLIDPRAAFARVRHVRESDAPPWGATVVGLQGEAVPGPRQPWYRRWLERPQWRRWTMWAARQQHLLLTGVFLCSDPVDHEAATIASLIIESLVIRPTPAEPALLFTARVAELLRQRFPSAVCKIENQLRVRVDDSLLNLDNAYRQYQLYAERFDEILLPTIESLELSRRLAERGQPPQLEEVRERILPMLYPEPAWREMLGETVASPWVAGMVVLYVVDEEHSYWFIRRELLAGWGWTPERLHGLALRNLESHFEANPMEITVAGEPDGPRLLLPNRPDAYNATRLLSETFLERLRDELGSPLAVGVPSRDLLVAISLHDEQAVEHVRVRVANDYGVMDHPLCQQLLLITRDGVSRYSHAGDDSPGESGDDFDWSGGDPGGSGLAPEEPD